MDVEACTAHASNLSTQNGNLQQVISGIESIVSQLVNDWRGTDSNKFHSEWNSTHKTNLMNIHNALNDFHTKLNQNIADQTNVSNA
jgi:WXG100 family type VII secretion target